MDMKDGDKEGRSDDWRVDKEDVGVRKGVWQRMWAGRMRKKRGQGMMGVRKRKGHGREGEEESGREDS